MPDFAAILFAYPVHVSPPDIPINYVKQIFYFSNICKISAARIDISVF